MNKEAKVLISIAAGTVLLLVAGVFLFQKTPTEAPKKEFDRALLVPDGTYKKGSESPKVTVVEFADFECPACAASAPITKQVLEKYKDSVQFVYRHFPLEQHKFAEAAALASEASAEQGKFWEMHDKLYDNQEAWAGKENAASLFEGYAKDLGLDVEKFKTDVAQKKNMNRINRGKTDGVAAGVNATPSFFVNGVKVSGVFTFDEWSRLLDKEINE